MFQNQQQQPAISTLLQKQNTHRNNLRQKQLTQKFKSIRQKLLSQQIPDYNILKSIDIDHNIHLIKQILDGKSQQKSTFLRIIKELHLYALSEQSDHLYMKFSGGLIGRLCLVVVGDLHPYLLHRQPMGYVQLVWTLCNYTSYDTSYLPPQFADMLIHLYGQLCHQTPHTIPHNDVIITKSRQSTLLELLVLAIKNMAFEQHYIQTLILKNIKAKYCLLDELMNICDNVANSYHQNHNKDLSQHKQIIIKIYHLYKILTETPPAAYHNPIISQTLAHLRIYHHTPIETYLLQIVNEYLLKHVANDPYIILRHNLEFIFVQYAQNCRELLCCLGEWRNVGKKIDLEGEKDIGKTGWESKMREVAIRLCDYYDVVRAIFAVNIPEDQNQDSYYQVLTPLFSQHIYPNLFAILTNPDPQLQRNHEQQLSLLKDLLLEPTFISTILEDLPILNKLFYFSSPHNSNYKLKRQSIRCLLNIIKMVIDNHDEDWLDDVLQLFSKNNIIQVMVEGFALFGQGDWYGEVLDGVCSLLGVEGTQKGEFNRSWRLFVAAGGVNKLEELMSRKQEQHQQKYCLPQQVYEKIGYILDYYTIQLSL